jgi:uncharacterized membrane protein HdeD (DUF308 family)
MGQAHLYTAVGITHTIEAFTLFFHPWAILLGVAAIVLSFRMRDAQ